MEQDLRTMLEEAKKRRDDFAVQLKILDIIIESCEELLKNKEEEKQDVDN